MNSQERGAAVAARDWNNDVIRYPDPAVEVIDPRFEAYINGNAALDGDSIPAHGGVKVRSGLEIATVCCSATFPITAYCPLSHSD